MTRSSWNMGRTFDRDLEDSPGIIVPSSCRNDSSCCGLVGTTDCGGCT